MPYGLFFVTNVREYASFSHNKENLRFCIILVFANFRDGTKMYIRVNSKRKVVDLAECYCIIANYMSREKGLEKEFSFSSSFSGAIRITLDPSVN